MAQKIRTEADKRATPRPPAPAVERGAHTRSKKNPGKRPKKGG